MEKKYNSIQLTKNKMVLNNRRNEKSSTLPRCGSRKCATHAPVLFPTHAHMGTARLTEIRQKPKAHKKICKNKTGMT